MRRYSIGNATAAASDAGESVTALWNPSSTISVFVTNVEIVVTTAVTGGTRIDLERLTAIGTAGATTTPDADSDYKGQGAPPSGATHRKANWSADTTKATPPLLSAHIGNPVGSSVNWWFPVPIEVPPGTGLGVSAVAALNAHSYWTWEE